MAIRSGTDTPLWLENEAVAVIWSFRTFRAVGTNRRSSASSFFGSEIRWRLPQPENQASASYALDGIIDVLRWKSKNIVKTLKSRRKGEPEDGFDVTSLSPEETGLPFVVFILQDIGVVPDIRVEVAVSLKVRRSDRTKVAIRPTVRVISGQLDACELDLLTRWVDLNRDALLRYWDGEIEYTEQVLSVLKPISGADE